MSATELLERPETTGNEAPETPAGKKKKSSFVKGYVILSLIHI